MKLLLLLIAFLFANASISQSQGYKFEKVVDLPSTSVKNQFSSGTCWSFAGLSFIESELLRLNKGKYDLSEMFIVRYTYLEKAIRYVRYHGHINFGGGGLFHDITYVIKKYGIIPEEIYPGLNYGTEKHQHGELDAVLKAYIDAVIKNNNNELSTAWPNGFEGILDAYLGSIPENFTYKGKKYTPKTFAESLDLNMDDYVTITSFTHHPFYEQFILELPDNWLHGKAYNVPLNELEEIAYYSLKNGYTIAWATDVSEKGFSRRDGLAIVPDFQIESLNGTERERWERLSQEDKDREIYAFNKPGNEKKITQEIRQKAFDNYSTTDDHGMHITGLYKEQNGTLYYLTKNSWDVNNPYDGYLYASSAFFNYKTTNIMVHKNAIPKSIAKKLNL